MDERTSKVLRTIAMPVLLALFLFIYYRLGLIEGEDLTWQLWVALGLIIPSGWLLIWRVRRRLLAVILMGAWCAFAIYATGLSLWTPIVMGAGVLVIVCALAFFPSRRLRSTN